MAVITTLEIETKLQERLDAPMVWKEICEVKYTNSGVVKNPYLTDATRSTGTRGTGYTSVAVATVDSSVTISDYVYSAQHIDDADLAQKSFSDFMEIADNMGTVLNEGMEIAMLLEHAQWTNFDNASIGGAAGNITVAVSNIKDIIGNIKEAIRTAGGGELLNRNGGFIQCGIKQGFRYMGMEHYSTSKNVSGHVFAGVKKAFTAYVVKSTYGRVKTIVNPVVGGAQISGVGYESRIDRKFKAWDKRVPVLFDVLVV